MKNHNVTETWRSPDGWRWAKGSTQQFIPLPELPADDRWHAVRIMRTSDGTWSSVDGRRWERVA